MAAVVPPPGVAAPAPLPPTADDGHERQDGRTDTMVRPAEVELSPLARADGSARWSAGATRVLAAVHGPRATLARCELPTAVAVSAEWSAPPAAPATPDTDDAPSLAAVVAGAARAAVRTDAAPRAAVTVAVAVAVDDGGALAAALNAASAALVDAGVPLRHTLAAAAVAVGCDGALAADPTAVEEAAASAVATFAFAARAAAPGARPTLDDRGAVAIHVRGRVPDDGALVAAEALARGAAAAAARLARAGLGRALGVE